MFVELVPVEEWHLEWVAAFPRAADVAEVWAAEHGSVGDALERGMAASLVSWTGLVDGEPACVMGVSPLSLLGGVGVPWLLGTDAIERAERPFLRLSGPVVDAMHGWFPRLVNFVDNRNERALRWLAHAGFTLSDPAPFGPEGLPFRRFERVAHV